VQHVHRLAEAHEVDAAGWVQAVGGGHAEGGADAERLLLPGGQRLLQLGRARLRGAGRGRRAAGVGRAGRCWRAAWRVAAAGLAPPGGGGQARGSLLACCRYGCRWAGAAVLPGRARQRRARQAQLVARAAAAPAAP
jgi:hypothetical protein